MRNTSEPIWTFFTVVILGFWLFTTPTTFGFVSVPLTISNWICGALLILLGWFARKKPKAIWIWSITAIGIWLQFTPLLFWAPVGVSYLNDTFVGSLVFLFSLFLHPLPGSLPDEAPYVPPRWSFNPSAWPTRIFIAFLAFTCWMASRYLAAYQLGYIKTIWDPFFSPGTKAVIESTISKSFPFPDAGIGAMAYTIEFFSVFLGGRNRWRTAPWAVLIFGILVIPVSLTSIILVILQPLAVGTWCTICLLTAACTLISIPFAISEVTATLQYLTQSREKSFFSLLFQGGLCPGATDGAEPLPLSSSLVSLWKSARCGITIPWNLAASVLIGIFLMVAPGLFKLSTVASDLDPIVGALAMVVSVISMSETIRSARLLNGIFGILMLAQLFWLHSTLFPYFYHGTAGILLIALSIRKGPIREQVG